MRWKQFLTPVETVDSEQAQKFMAEKASDELTILDVRQPNEYESGHIPGAKLIPLPDLIARMDDIDPNKPTVVY
jgi:rhodanese-related sulfurtransferase